MTVVFTSVNGSYLPKARILASSAKRHNPDIRFALFLAELNIPDWLTDNDTHLFDIVLGPRDVDYNDPLGWAIQHSIVEYCTAVKPQIALQLLTSYKDSVIYLDPDIAVFSSLGPIESLFLNHPIVLTPHLLDPESEFQAIKDNEISALKHGVYNLGFFGVNYSQYAVDFLKWYSKRLYYFCHDNPSDGLFTDQKWCDLVPVFFPNMHIFMHPGCNVASWNISRRFLGFNSQGTITSNGHPLIFYHFTGYDNGSGRAMTSKYSNNNAIVEGLWDWYDEQVKYYRNYTVLPWSMSHFASGEIIQVSTRHRIRLKYFPSMIPGDPYRLSNRQIHNLCARS